MTPNQYKEMLNELVSIPRIAERLMHEQLRYMRTHINALQHELDCRVYIDRQSHRELISSILGPVTSQAFEFLTNSTFNGFKIYVVDTDERLLDVTVREVD